MIPALLPIVLGGAGLVATGALKLRTLGQPAARSLARPADVRALTPRAVMRTAKRLRALDKNPTDGETGVALGLLAPRGPRLRATWRNTVLVIAGPGSGEKGGKTSALAIPATLEAPGPVVCTSSRADLWQVTHSRRVTLCFDPQHIIGAEQTFWVDLLAHIDNVEASWRLAGNFIATVEDTERRDMWGSAAQGLLNAFFLAAASGGRTLLDAYRWLHNPLSTEAYEILRDHGWREVAEALADKQNAPEKTRGSVYFTASVAVQCLQDPRITAWITPSKLPRFNPTDFVHSTDALHLLSKGGGSGAGPLTAALADVITRTAEHEAERAGGRLNPPLVLVLDEAANTCRIPDLPQSYSYWGGCGIIPITFLQSYAQGAHAWGRDGIKTLLGANVLIVGAGINDPTFASEISSLVGEHDVPTRSYGSGRSGNTHNRSVRRDRIMSTAQVRAIKPGTALLFATGSKPALITLQPWYKDKRWKDR
jgi:type IV secretory pathway TraG/TraD family ATPase VirD4